MNPLASIAASLLERSANAALSLDPVAGAKLSELHGRQIAIACSEPAAALEVTIADDTLRVLARPCERPHVRVSGTLPALLQAMMSGRSSGVSLIGDESVLIGLQDVFRRLQPDLARPLSALVGDQRADALVGAGETAAAMATRFASHTAEDLGEAALSEIAQRSDAEALMDRIEALRERVDRAGARIKQLAVARAES